MDNVVVTGTGRLIVDALARPSMTEAPRTKKSHYLPRFYLAGFTAEGTEKSWLLVFDRELGEVRRGKPIPVGYERYFYALPGDAQDSFEEDLGKDEDGWRPPGWVWRHDATPPARSRPQTA